MNTLYFEKISKYERASEPVNVSIPFAQGRLTDPARWVIRDGAKALPAQARILSQWPDGSIKWLFAHFQPDLPGNRDKTLTFDIVGKAESVESAAKVALQVSANGIAVDTGPLQFLVPKVGYLPVTEVVLNGQPILGGAFKGFTMRVGGQTVSTAKCSVTLGIEEAGPLCAVILVKGKHQKADGAGYIEFRGRVTAYAGKPYIEVEHQFIHSEAEKELVLEEIRLEAQPQAAGKPKLALGEGWYQTRIQESEAPLAMTIDTETILYQSNEHFIDSYYGDFWADWRDGAAGVTISHYQAHQNYPKGLRVAPEGLTAYLYPPDVPPQTLIQGVAKMHRLGLQFHGPQTPLAELCARSLQFQLPDHPALAADWYRANNPWGMDFFPAQVPDRFLTMMSIRHDQRPKGLGMLHFGDAPDAGYTNQGRGRGQTVWVNNEYDRAHACALFYGLTGQRRVFDSGLVSARHWLDVDICHYSENPLIQDGIKIHTAHHITGGVTPSHEWVEGLLDYYYFTGRREALEAAHGVAENIMRHMAQPRMMTPGESAVREGGWALRAMVAMALATGEERYYKESRRLVDLFLSWDELYGGMLAPYTSHSMPRVVFMIGLTICSIARYLSIEDDERVKKLIVTVCDDLIKYCLAPGGVFYYKELPSLRRIHPTVHAIECLTHAYRVSGNRRYLKVAARQFFEFVAREATPPFVGVKRAEEGGGVSEGEGNGRPFADAYPPLLYFVGAATPAGLLDWYEYPV